MVFLVLLFVYMLLPLNIYLDVPSQHVLPQRHNSKGVLVN